MQELTGARRIIQRLTDKAEEHSRALLLSIALGYTDPHGREHFVADVEELSELMKNITPTTTSHG